MNVFFPIIMSRTNGGSGGTVAKDAIGNDIVAAEWLKNHGPGDRTLTQGLKVRYWGIIYH